MDIKDKTPSLGLSSYFSIEEIEYNLNNNYCWTLYPNEWKAILEERIKIMGDSYVHSKGFPLLVAKKDSTFMPFLSIKNGPATQNQHLQKKFLEGLDNGMQEAYKMFPLHKNKSVAAIDYYDNSTEINGGSAALSSFIATILHLASIDTPSNWGATGCLEKINNGMQFVPSKSLDLKIAAAIAFGLKKIFIIEGSDIPSKYAGKIELKELPRNPRDAFFEIVKNIGALASSEDLHLAYLFQIDEHHKHDLKLHPVISEYQTNDGLDGGYANLLIGKNYLHKGETQQASSYFKKAESIFANNTSKPLDNPLNLFIQLHLPAQIIISYIDTGEGLIHFNDKEKSVLPELIEIDSKFQLFFETLPTKETGYGLLAFKNSLGRLYESYGSIFKDKKAIEKSWQYRIQMKDHWESLYEYAKDIPHFSAFDSGAQYNQCVDVLYRHKVLFGECPANWLNTIKDYAQNLYKDIPTNFYDLLAYTRWHFILDQLDNSLIESIWSTINKHTPFNHSLTAVAELLLTEYQQSDQPDQAIKEEIIKAIRSSGVYQNTDETSILSLLKQRSKAVLGEAITSPDDQAIPLNKIINELCKSPDEVFARMVY